MSKVLVHTYTYIYIYIYTRTYIHTYIHRYIDTYIPDSKKGLGIRVLGLGFVV